MTSVSSRDSQGRNLNSPAVRACGDGRVHRGTLNPGRLCMSPRGKPAEPGWLQEAGEHSGQGSAGDSRTPGSDLDTVPFRLGTSVMNGHSLSEPFPPARTPGYQ